MLTRLYPMVQFFKDTWEIDEFDCASIFLLIGSKKAMVIDCGMGIGDLRGAIEGITDKPLVTVISHGHVDHTGNARQFKEIYMNPKDNDKPIPQSLGKRREDTLLIARRQKGLYPYDIDTDLREPIDEPEPRVLPLTEGQRFDLGDRVITAYECPGHSPGEMVFLDEKTRSLFCGDALNYNLGLGATSIEKALFYLKRLEKMAPLYDGIYNGHHDFRPLGVPLGKDCLKNAVEICSRLMDGTAEVRLVPSFWGPDSGRPPRLMAVLKNNYIGFDPENFHEKS